ncbi:protein phosphatase 2C domain-containing protein [Allosalinactinospora lopnorensis]|uniref:protein phosphatase 2C domain-containing protein n=1 Tax=Allosalinactinospora lopnorensis TaxID=1352348 RepID=UPI000623EDD0|nr:protein phosphatase 2C domain-containing protein [Allosalinactinospora lopnorensis]
MRIRYASAPGDGCGNEDLASSGADWAFVLDGATAPPDVDSGCRHGVRWFVATLAASLAAELALPCHRPLPDVLAHALERTRAAHGGTCDLANPDSPSSTVAMVRHSGPALEYLVLADSAVLLPGPGGTVTPVTDDRLDHLPGGRPYTRALVRSARNSPDGFWVAGSLPEAAHQAVTGTARPPGLRFGLLTDGCTRLVKHYGHTWHQLWQHLEKRGPESLIARVRDNERTYGAERGKRHDDATALVGAFAPVSG